MRFSNPREVACELLCSRDKATAIDDGHALSPPWLMDSASDGLESQPPEKFSISKYLSSKRRSKCPSAEEGQDIAKELSDLEEAKVGMDPKANHSEVWSQMWRAKYGDKTRTVHYLIFEATVQNFNQFYQTARLEGTLHKPSEVPLDGYRLRKVHRKATEMRNHVSKQGKRVRRAMTSDAVPVSPTGAQAKGLHPVTSEKSAKFVFASASACLSDAGQSRSYMSSSSTLSLAARSVFSSLSGALSPPAMPKTTLPRSDIVPDATCYSISPRAPLQKPYLSTRGVLTEPWVDPTLKERRIKAVMDTEPVQRARRVTSPAALTPYSEDHFSPRNLTLCQEEVERKLRQQVLDFHDRECYRKQAASILGQRLSMEVVEPQKSLFHPMSPMVFRGNSYEPEHSWKQHVSQPLQSMFSFLACGKASKTLD